MNKHISSNDLVAPKVTTGPITGSRKTYSNPEAAPDLRVPHREVPLTEAAGEAPVPVIEDRGMHVATRILVAVGHGVLRDQEGAAPRGGPCIQQRADAVVLPQGVPVLAVAVQHL